MEYLSNNMKECSPESDKTSTYLIDEIKKLNPSFSLTQLLNDELNKEHKMEQIKSRFSYQFYLKVKGTCINIRQGDEDDTLDIGTDVLSMKDLFKGDILKSERPNFIHKLILVVKTGKGCKIEDVNQFVHDLKLLKRRLSPLSIEPEDRFDFEYNARM